MGYLSDNEMIEIKKNVRLVSIDNIDDISHFVFDSGVEE